MAASLIDATIEWYDYFLHGTAAALVFAKLFFPHTDPPTGTLLSFLTYAIGFAAQPIAPWCSGTSGTGPGERGCWW